MTYLPGMSLNHMTTCVKEDRGGDSGIGAETPVPAPVGERKKQPDHLLRGEEERVVLASQQGNVHNVPPYLDS